MTDQSDLEPVDKAVDTLCVMRTPALIVGLLVANVAAAPIPLIGWSLAWAFTVGFVDGLTTGLAPS